MKIIFKLAGISFAVWFCFFCVINNGWGQSVEAPKWVVGDTWDVDIILYSRGWGLAFSDPKMEERKHKPHVLARYTVKIAVTADLKCRDIDCWQLDFIPMEKDKTPPGIREQKFRVFVSKENGSMIDIVCLSGENFGEPKPRDIDGITILRYAPYGFPLEIIPWSTNKFTGVNKTILTVAKNESILGNEKHKELIVRQGTNEVPRITQKWAKGAKWWSEYERYISGHIELQAKLIEKDSQNLNNGMLSQNPTNDIGTNNLAVPQLSTNSLTP